MSELIDLPGRDDVLAAAARISARVLVTPLVSRASLNAELGFELFLKCENQQRTGSFKYRGATNAVTRLVTISKPAAVATHSSGNHGAALALAARLAGIEAKVVVPAGANPLKRAAVTRYGGTVISCGDSQSEREAVLEKILRETGATFIPPYDHADVIAGQGTAALEILSALPDLQQLWVPVGGGGLASGCLQALAGSSVEVRGAEPELADDAYWSLEKGQIQPQRPPRTVADGLRTALGELPFQIFRQHDFRIELVSEAQILAAQQLLWQRLKLVVEPSGAVPLAGMLAAARRSPELFQEQRVGVILSGGNAAFPAQDR